MRASLGRLILLALLSLSSANSQMTPTSNPRSLAPNQKSQLEILIDNLKQAQELIKAGKIPDALTLLDETKHSAIEYEIANLALKEDILWQTAEAHSDFSTVLTNAEQYKHYAGLARGQWKDYIDWFDGLSDGERAKLPAGHVRINAATRHWGNATIRMDEHWLLFDDYNGISRIEDLGTEAIELWKNTLYECPEWHPVPDRTPSVRREKICSKDCKDQWLAYADTIKMWADKANLRKPAQAVYMREAAQINEEANACKNP
jgi:hypothetical protein